jgi:xanthine dehydrogenase accessory factor
MDASDDAAITDEVLRALQGGPPVLVATTIGVPGGPNGGGKLLVRPDGSFAGSLGVPVLDAAILAGLEGRFRRRGVRTLFITETGEEVPRRNLAGREAYCVMVEVHERPETLLIVGAGHIGQALCRLGAMCGFRVTVVDDRPEYADPDRLQEAAEVIRGRFEEVLTEYPVDSATYIVCVTRGHKHDEVSLKTVVGRSAAYVGMIGSRRRAKAVLAHLVEDGVDPEAVAAVHTPIGLDIGAETPEEIAVSVMAEIVKVRRGGSGASMSSR